MKKTIQSRISLVLIIAIAFIVLNSSLSLYYISRISVDVNKLIVSDIEAGRSATRIRELTGDLVRAEKIYLDALINKEDPIDLVFFATSLKEAIVDHQKWSVIEKNKVRITQLLKDVDTYLNLIPKADTDASEAAIRKAGVELSRLNETMQVLTNEIMETRVTEFKKHQQEMTLLTSKGNRNMLLLFLILIIGGTVLIVIAPRRVTSPFRRYIAAIKEVEDLKFDTRLRTTGEDEVAELGRAVNRLIDRFHEFDEIKQKRIQFEKSKQRVLANMLDLGVMMLAIEGDVLFLNAQLASVLDLSTDSYQSKDFHMVDIPDEIKDMITEVLNRRERIDSRMMILSYSDTANIEVLVDVGLVRNYRGDVVNIVITFEDITNPPGKSVFKRISFKEQELV